MKNKVGFSISLIVGAFLIFASSCKKDDDIINNSFTDPRDGNVYKTVTIGNQVWMAENLKYLPSVVGPLTGSSTTALYYVYGYTGTVVADAKATANYNTYGVLYNWAAAMNGEASSDANPSGVQGICPTGWHLPSDAEWTELVDYLGGENVAGGKLKEIDFTALYGGYRHYNGVFFGSEYSGYWWSATEFVTNTAFYRKLYSDESDLTSLDGYKSNGYSVRCVKD